MHRDVISPNANSVVKLYIIDVLKSKRCSREPNFYYFRGEKIRSADIMGTVTEVRIMNGTHRYKVDDSTGVIDCIHQPFKQKISEIRAEWTALLDEARRMPDDESSKTLRRCLRECESRFCPEALQQGDTANIQGFISDFHGCREIKVFDLCKVSGFQDEIDRAFELVTYYSRIYDKWKEI